MNSKRKFSDFNADSSAQGESREFIPGSHASKKLKEKNGKKNKTKPGSMNWVKKRVRTIERRFKAGHNMPANVQNDLERELAHYQQTIVETADEKKRKAMIKKYHMVRFFERKKADRLAKRIESQLKTATDATEIEKLNADLHKAKIDGIYTRFFPYRERYISLYPATSSGPSADGGEKAEDASSAAAQALHTDRPPLWEVIEMASEKGTRALIDIRERKVSTDSKDSSTNTGKDPALTKSSHAKAKDSESSKDTSGRPGKGKGRRNQPPSSSRLKNDSDSEGGFFEEE